jgi:hypothetical protein
MAGYAWGEMDRWQTAQLLLVGLVFQEPRRTSSAAASEVTVMVMLMPFLSTHVLFIIS